jgi:phosphatidylglycerol lysyltransferase
LAPARHRAQNLQVPEELDLPDPRKRVLAILRRHGTSTVSFQLLEDGFRYFFDGDGVDAGFVAYLDTGGAWVAGGAPVAPRGREAVVAQAFVGAAQRAGRRACFFGVESESLPALGGNAIRVGEQPIWDPRTWDQALAGSASLRYQLRRARSKGVRVRAVAPAELADPASLTRRGIERVIERWQRARPMAPMGFLVDLQPFSDAAERMAFVAERGGRVVGFLVAVPVFARDGWFFEDLLRADDAPNGTAELLFDTAMRVAASRGATMATLGLAPLAGDVPRVLAMVRDLSTWLYDFRGLHAFKRKLAPERWEPVFLCAPTPTWLALYDALVAFARGSMLRFGLHTLLRGPKVVVHALAIALAVWTLVLCGASPTHWFPSHAAKWAWVLANLLVLAGLGTLGRRHRPHLAVAIAALVTLDAGATCAEALAYNVSRVASALDVVVVATACAGPLVASLALWGMVRRRRERAA